MVGYQDRDAEIVDYRIAALDGVGTQVRGPLPPLDDGRYFSCLGAAQTFGALVEEPYPTLVSGELGLPVLNLGVAGAGPRFFVQRPALLAHVNRGRMAIVQVMSARSEDNDRFTSGGLELLTLPDGSRLGAEPAYRRLIEEESEETVRAVVDQTRRNWVASYRSLFAMLTVPTVLLWLSTRTPRYSPNYKQVHGLFGAFPQLVDAAMVDDIRGSADTYVEVVSDRGLPQRLVSRFTGQPTFITGRADLGSRRLEYNTYYPTPEMHADASEALVGACRALLGAVA
jgi:hypothetical protein